MALIFKLILRVVAVRLTSRGYAQTFFKRKKRKKESRFSSGRSSKSKFFGSNTT